MSRHRRLVLAVVNLKGGTSKTTSAVHFAHALHELGRRVMLVDGDPQASALTWNQQAPEPFPFPVIGLPNARALLQLSDAVPPDRDAVVIDTPPLEQKSGVVVSALRVASFVVVPMAPAGIEYDRLKPIQETVEDTASLRADGEPAPLAVLLTRTHPTAASTGAYREQIEADGYRVLKAHVGTLQRYSQAYGENVDNALNSAYGDAVNEILEVAG